MNHILASHSDEIMQHKRTLYRYVDKGVFSARNIDMPRVVRMGKRKIIHTFKVEKKCRVNRLYSDYKAFMEENPGLPVVEIDTVEGIKGGVEGIKGGKVLLTMHFLAPQFMLAFIRDANTARSVTDIFEHIYDLIGLEQFKELFPVILGDNGGEFSNPTAIELTPCGVSRSRLFYCDPSAPYRYLSI